MEMGMFGWMQMTEFPDSPNPEFNETPVPQKQPLLPSNGLILLSLESI